MNRTHPASLARVLAPTFTFDSPHSCADGGRRWPILEGIAFIRSGRETLADRALAALDAGDESEALARLLADRDDWDPTIAPSHDALRRLVDEGSSLTFRAAMQALGYGDVATYFAHRSSDPTFVAGLGLLAAHRPRAGTRSFELACGVGHYLRELERVGVDAAGGDVVFSKLWLARRFIAPNAALVCFDAAEPWPIVSHSFDLVHVHDALYFLPNKERVASELNRIARADGTIAISHAHNAVVDNFSSGAPLDRVGYAALFPGAVCYDDRALADAVVRGESIAGIGRVADAAGVTDASDSTNAIDRAAAFAFVVGPTAREPNATLGDVALPAVGTQLVRNPLYERALQSTTANEASAAIVWPSERYEREYAELATYPPLTTAPSHAIMSADPKIVAYARTRELVALPENW